MRFLLIPLLFISLVAGAQSPAPTSADANPREVLNAWLASFNRHDVATREQWLLENTTLTAEQAQQIAMVDQKIRSEHGPFELIRVVRTEGHMIEVQMRHTGTGGVARMQVTLDQQDPKRIADVRIQPVKVKGNGDGPG
ncbi:MAG TPA: hypothetical protein VF701_12180 [Thermoanaerobaculia bacterium]